MQSEPMSLSALVHPSSAPGMSCPGLHTTTPLQIKSRICAQGWDRLSGLKSPFSDNNSHPRIIVRTARARACNVFAVAGSKPSINATTAVHPLRAALADTSPRQPFWIAQTSVKGSSSVLLAPLQQAFRVQLYRPVMVSLGVFVPTRILCLDYKCLEGRGQSGPLFC